MLRREAQGGEWLSPRSTKPLEHGDEGTEKALDPGFLVLASEPLSPTACWLTLDVLGTWRKGSKRGTWRYFPVPSREGDAGP